MTFEIPQENIYGYPAPTGWELDIHKIRKLGWEPKGTLKEMYEQMLAYWEHSQ